MRRKTKMLISTLNHWQATDSGGGGGKEEYFKETEMPIIQASLTISYIIDIINIINKKEEYT